MEKQKILAISHRENYICYKLEKKSSYYDFLFSLLKEFNIKVPDLYDDNGKLPDVMIQEDDCSYDGNDDINIIEVFGHKCIFLIISTDLQDKLNKFIEKNCVFSKSEKKLVGNKIV